MERLFRGRSIQSRGARTEKARSALVRSLDFGPATGTCLKIEGCRRLTTPGPVPPGLCRHGDLSVSHGDCSVSRGDRCSSSSSEGLQRVYFGSITPEHLGTQAGMALLCKSAVLWLLLVWARGAGACICPNATVLSLPPSIAPPPGGCCLNFSGSALGPLNWAWFSNVSGLEVLDLSHCNITHIHKGATDRGPTSLTKLFLNHNALRSVPGGLLSSMFNLTELHLEDNQLQDLPPDLLQDSHHIQKLYLNQNKLNFLPADILKKPSLTTLDIHDNPWDCSCQFIEEIQLSYNGNRSTDQDALANLTCASPPPLAGRAVLSVSVGEVCHPTRLTALFITLPLLILSTLVLCWCCGRTKSKEAPMFNAKKKGHNNHSNGHKQLPKPPPASDSTQDPKNESIVQNQLLLRPSSALLSSTRDIYQEVEGRLGSVDSSPRDGSLCSSLGEGRPGSRDVEAAEAVEVDAVSVTEVLRDSADREKAYLTQSTEYYSLVPGLQLDDSDHGEFDNVDLT